MKPGEYRHCFEGKLKHADKIYENQKPISLRPLTNTNIYNGDYKQVIIQLCLAYSYHAKELHCSKSHHWTFEISQLGKLAKESFIFYTRKKDAYFIQHTISQKASKEHWTPRKSRMSTRLLQTILYVSVYKENTAYWSDKDFVYRYTVLKVAPAESHYEYLLFSDNVYTCCNVRKTNEISHSLLHCAQRCS